jgi:putative sterol carrier protein
MADIQQFFSEYLPNKIAGNPELIEKVNASYQFDLEGAGVWTVDLTGGEGVVREGPTDEPGCVVTCAAADFETLLDNPMSAMMLFTMGKLQVSNVSLAMSLQELLG